jgi:hypothetical protein
VEADLAISRERVDPARAGPVELRIRTLSGPVAQLGARMNGIHEVTGSIPVWSTILSFPPSIVRK